MDGRIGRTSGSGRVEPGRGSGYAVMCGNCELAHRADMFKPGGSIARNR
jgi:hypothetical protein